MRRLTGGIAASIVFLSIPSDYAASDTMGMTGDPTKMLMPTTADSFTLKVAAIPRSGWTATASDQASSYPASNAIDGIAATFWHSAYSPTTVPLPHSITIDMHATNQVVGLTYLPRQDSSRNGTIGQYSISVSTDGTTWRAPVATGTRADNKTKKTAEFASVPARYARLPDLTGAGHRHCQH